MMIHLAWKRFLILAVLIASPSAGLAQSAVADLHPTDTLPLDAAVRRGRLPNGFQYFILKHGQPKGEVELRLVVNAGWFHEDEDQLGLAHLLEHMAFNGTKHFPRIRESFMKWGLVPGRNWNGGTGRVTDYWLLFSTDKPALYDSAFQVMRDWAQDLTLEAAEIDAERGVVLGEAQKDDAVSRLQREMEAGLLNHPKYPQDWYETHDESIRTFEHSRLRRFFRDWYRPDLQALIVVGDIDEHDVERRIEALFSDLEMPPDPRQAPDIDAAYDVPLTGKNQFLAVAHESVSNTLVRIYHKRKTRGWTIRTVGDYRMELIEKLYNEMMEVRFASLTRRYNAPFRLAFHSIRSYLFRPSARIAGLGTELSFDNSQPIGPGIRGALIELERARKYGFRTTELDRARALLRKEIADQRPPSLSDLAKRLVKHYSEGGAAPPMDQERVLRSRLLDEIDVDVINDIARDWLSSSTDRDVEIMAPSSLAQRLPTEEEVNGWFEEARSAAVAEYVEPKARLERLMTDAEIAALRSDPNDEVQYNDEIGTTELRLRDGITVILKPFKPSRSASSRISFKGSSPGGFLAYEPDRALTAAQSASIVANAGVGTFDKFELDTFLKAKDVSGGPDLFGRTATVNGSAPPKELESLLQLVHLYLTAPRRDSAAFEDWKSHQLSRVEEIDAHPVGWFESVIDTIRYRAALPIRLNARREIVHIAQREDIERVREDDAYRVYEQTFMRPGEFAFALAGDFDLEAVIPLVARYLGSLPSTKPIRPKHGDSGNAVEVQMGPVDATLYRGMNDQGDVRLFFSGRYNPTLMAKAQLDVLARALEIRIHERLREKEGGTYSTSTSVDPGRIAEGTYTFAVSFIAAPDNVDHMIGAAVEEIERLREEGLDETLFEAAVSRSLEWFAENQVNSASSWTEYLLDMHDNGGDPTDILKWRGLLKDSLTREAINEAARQYLHVQNMMRFVLLPEEA